LDYISLETSIEIFICDMQYYPFYRIRNIAKIEIPYINGSVGGILELIRCLLTFRKLFEQSYLTLKEIIIMVKVCNINDEVDLNEDDEDNDRVSDEEPIILTINSPKKIK